MPILGQAAYAYAAAASNASETTLRITCANKALKILNYMKTKHYLITLLAILLSPIAHATTIEIDLGPPSTIYTGYAQIGPIAFSNLNGLPLSGSSVSLNFFFTNNEFVQLFSNTAPSFDIGVSMFSNAGTFPGFATNATAYLIDQNGAAIPGLGSIGEGDGDNGSFGLGFFPLANGTPSFPLDFYGVHFSFNLPNDSGVTITGAKFLLTDNGKQWSQFAVGPHVPDSGSSLSLLISACFSLLGLKLYGLKVVR